MMKFLSFLLLLLVLPKYAFAQNLGINDINKKCLAKLKEKSAQLENKSLPARLQHAKNPSTLIETRGHLAEVKSSLDPKFDGYREDDQKYFKRFDWVVSQLMKNKTVISFGFDYAISEFSDGDNTESDDTPITHSWYAIVNNPKGSDCSFVFSTRFSYYSFEE